jgi:hypothetical protein
MTLKNVGWLRMGIGSAVTRQFLIRVEGPSVLADDDLVLEAKEVFPLRSSCLKASRSSEAFRVVAGVRQIARLHPPLLVALPGIDNTRPSARDWWVRNWDRPTTRSRSRTSTLLRNCRKSRLTQERSWEVRTSLISQALWPTVAVFSSFRASHVSSPDFGR